MRKFPFHCLLVAVVSLVSVNSASADLVDYFKLDIGPTGQRVESGFVGLIAAPNSGTNNTNYAATPGYVSLFGSDPLTVAINSINAAGNPIGGIDWRDRGDSTSTDALVQLAEDHVKNNSGIIRLTLTGLRAGTYSATSFHKDPGFDQSNPIQLSIAVDGGAFVVNSATGNAGVNTALNSLTTALINDSAANFSFTTNGTGPVILLWNGDILSGDNEAPLNGLILQVDQVNVPEPATASLALLGLGGLMLRRRRMA